MLIVIKALVCQENISLDKEVNQSLRQRILSNIRVRENESTIVRLKTKTKKASYYG